LLFIECDEGTIAFFEKTTLHELSSTAVDRPQTTKLDTRGVNVGITAACSTACLDAGTARCPAFVVDYSTPECGSLDRNTQGIEDQLRPSVGLVNYFEKVCLKRSTLAKNAFI
jgi:hypothetical protein